MISETINFVADGLVNLSELEAYDRDKAALCSLNVKIRFDTIYIHTVQVDDGTPLEAEGLCSWH
jgi:hypothetical protein